jgi:hypothetical protein
MAAAGWWLKASATNSIGLSLDVPSSKDEASVTSEEAAVDSWVLLLAKNIYYIASAQKHRQLRTTGCSS